MKNKFFVFAIFAILLIFLVGCRNSSDGDDNSYNDGNDSSNSGTYEKDFWGTWIRMDTGGEYKITNNKITKGTSSSEEKITSLNKSSDNILLLDGKYLLFRKGGYNRSFSMQVSGFSQSRSALMARAADGFVDVLVRTNTENSGDTQSVKVDGTGTINFTDAVADSTQLIKAGSSYTDVEIAPVEVMPQYDGENVGTFPIVEKDRYGFKTTYTISNANNDNGYLYGNLYKTYDLTLEVKNIGSVDCSTSVYEISCNDSRLEFVSGALSGNFTTIEPYKEPKDSKKVELKVRYGMFESSFDKDYRDVKININIKDVGTMSTWEDSVSLRFYRKPVSLYVNAKNFNSKGTLNGFVIHPNGKSQFFKVSNGNKNSVSFPWSKSDYKLAFSGADADTEMGYSFSTTSELADLNSTFTLEELASFEPNNSENSCTRIKNIFVPTKSYLQKNDIDFYSFNVSGVSQIYSPVIASKFLIDDATSYSTGKNNDDDKIQPGETIYMDVSVNNTTNSEVNIIGVLSSASDYVTVEQGNANYGKISAGYYASTHYTNQSSPYTYINTSKAFKFTVSESAPVGTKLPFVLTMTDAQGNVWTDSFELEIVATGANLVYEKNEIKDLTSYNTGKNNGDNKIQGGETIYMDVSIQNSGTSKVLDVNTVLSSTSGYVTIEQGNAAYGTISARYHSSTYYTNQSSPYTYINTSKAFKFTVSESAPVGTKLPFALTMTDAQGNVWTDSFELEIQ